MDIDVRAIVMQLDPFKMLTWVKDVRWWDPYVLSSRPINYGLLLAGKNRRHLGAILLSRCARHLSGKKSGLTTFDKKKVDGSRF